MNKESEYKNGEEEEENVERKVFGKKVGKENTSGWVLGKVGKGKIREIKERYLVLFVIRFV